MRGYVVNNIRGEPHEERNIGLLPARGLPIVRVSHRGELHDVQKKHIKALIEIGKTISKLV